MIAVRTVRFVDDRQETGVPGKGLTSSLTANENVAMAWDPVAQLLRVASRGTARFIPASRVMFFESLEAPAPAKAETAKK